MKLEVKFLIIALLAAALAIPVAQALQKRDRELRIERSEKRSIQLRIESVEKQAEHDRIELEKQQQKNQELQKQLEAKAEREVFLAKLEFPVGAAPAWKVRDALAFYLDEGLTETAAAYLVGNLVAESALDHTNKSGDGGRAHGLAQWHPNRRHDMPDDYHGQLAFVLTEMQRQTPEAYRIVTSNPTPYELARAMKIFEGYSVEGNRFHYGSLIAARL